MKEQAHEQPQQSTGESMPPRKTKPQSKIDSLIKIQQLSHSIEEERSNQIGTVGEPTDQPDSSSTANEQWNAQWHELITNLKIYLQNGSATKLVNTVERLASLAIDAGYDDAIQNLGSKQSWPEFEDKEIDLQVAICSLVIEILIQCRTKENTKHNLVKQLNDLTPRPKIQKLGYLQAIVESGHWARCGGCKHFLLPDRQTDFRCENCIKAEKETIYQLHIAMECERLYGEGAVYTGGISRHFRVWERWRNRILDHLGRDTDSDVNLWNKWVTYVRREHGLEKQEFWKISFSDAEDLLPPVRKSSTDSKEGKSSRDKLKRWNAARIDNALNEAELHLKWENAGRPKTASLTVFLRQQNQSISLADFKKLRGRVRKNRLSFTNHNDTQEYISLLKNHIR